MKNGIYFLYKCCLHGSNIQLRMDLCGIIKEKNAHCLPNHGIQSTLVIKTFN